MKLPIPVIISRKMRLIHRKCFRKCMFLSITVFLLLLAVWMLDPLLGLQRALEKRIAPIPAQNHSQNLLQQIGSPLSRPQAISASVRIMPPSQSPQSPAITRKPPIRSHSFRHPPLHHGEHPSQMQSSAHVPSHLPPSNSYFQSPPRPTLSKLSSQFPPQPPSDCAKPHCEEVLSRGDKVRQKACLSDVLKHNSQFHPKELASKILENNCDFMVSEKRAPVALIGAEGSGNTWVRGLLERSSGFCTGFNFCDYVMRMNGFIGENINSGSVLVVKTHMKMPQWIGSQKKIGNRYETRYGSAIFLLRNPYYSLIAEWNRRLTNDVLIKQHRPHNESHINVAPKEIWFSDSWDEFLHSYMTFWVERVQNWVLVEHSRDHPVMVVRYEDLKQNTTKEVGRMLSFLQIPLSSEDLAQRLKEDFTTFRRSHSEGDFEHYTAAQKLHMKSSLQHAIGLAAENNMTQVLRLNDYLIDLE